MGRHCRRTGFAKIKKAKAAAKQSLLNDAGTPLSAVQLRILSLGLALAPTQPRPGWRDTLQAYSNAIDTLNRKINGHLMETGHHFALKTIGEEKLPPDPPTKDFLTHTAEVKTLQRWLKKQCTKGTRSNTWTYTQQEQWKQLIERDDIFIISADKGGKTVIWEAELYVKEAYRQLGDTRVYAESTVEELIRAVASTMKDISGVATLLHDGGFITRKYATHLTNFSHCKLPPIYFLPKIHKPKNPSTNTFEGRPIMANTTGLLKRLDLLITDLTKALLPRIEGSLKDTIHFLDIIKDRSFPVGATLFTADVKALYPSIPWEEGIAAATEIYSQHLQWLTARHQMLGVLPPPTPELLEKALRLVITRNFLHFRNASFHHQISGTAMGSSVSVFFANAFMRRRHHRILTNPPMQLHLFLRYIDDIFGVWLGAPEGLNELLKTEGTISYTVEWAPAGGYLPFLDVATKLLDGKISTTLYRKPTDGQQYLNFSSCHPEHCKKSIPVAQLKRFKRLCMSDGDYRSEKTQLFKVLSEQGYSKEVLGAAAQRAEGASTAVHTASAKKWRLILPFHPNLHELPRKFNELLTSLRTRFEPTGGFGEHPLAALEAQVVFQRCATLGGMAGARIKTRAPIPLSSLDRLLE